MFAIYIGNSHCSVCLIICHTVLKFRGGASFVDILCFCSVLCLLCLCARLSICALWSPAWKGLTSWLSFVVSYCEFVPFPLVSWVRCGTLLYRFLIFSPLLTLKKNTAKYRQIDFLSFKFHKMDESSSILFALSCSDKIKCIEPF